MPWVSSRPKPELQVGAVWQPSYTQSFQVEAPPCEKQMAWTWDMGQDEPGPPLARLVSIPFRTQQTQVSINVPTCKRGTV